MTGTQISYYYLCTRKLWLFTNHVDMEQTNENVALGKVISETTYQRQKHEIHIADEKNDIVLDFYDGKTKTIHEVKKSDKMEDVHIWQVKFYISVLEEKGIKNVTGKIDYPKLKQTITVTLSEKDKTEIKQIEKEIKKITQQETPPRTIDKPFCKQCAYYDLCYV